ncbi:MAG: hypothetical protein J0H82_19220 [Alphaproteobacteria bacterium]|jgi:hypothetical protein|nr:hypothetical protein [Alphaproteobacteria bacterium]
MFVINPFVFAGGVATVIGQGNTPYASSYAATNGYVSIDQGGEGGSYRILATASAPNNQWSTLAFVGGPNLWGAGDDVYQEMKLVAAPNGISLVAGVCNDGVMTSRHVGFNTSGLGFYAGTNYAPVGVYYNDGLAVNVADNSGTATPGSRVTVRVRNAAGQYRVDGYIDGLLIAHGSITALPGNSYMGLSLFGSGTMIECTRASQVRHPIAGSVYLG